VGSEMCIRDSEESNKVAAEWVKKNPAVLPAATRVTTGEVIGYKVAGELVGQGQVAGQKVR